MHVYVLAYACAHKDQVSMTDVFLDTLFLTLRQCLLLNLELGGQLGCMGFPICNYYTQDYSQAAILGFL